MQRLLAAILIISCLPALAAAQEPAEEARRILVGIHESAPFRHG